MISQDEFLEWKAHPVTKAFFQEVNNQINEGLHELAYTMDTDRMRLIQGGIQKLVNIQQVDFEGVLNGD